jgi:Mu transposase, C-terminal domain
MAASHAGISSSGSIGPPCGRCRPSASCTPSGARVNIDYHVDVERHYYSVPYRLIHQVLDIRLSATTVEVFQRGTRLWVHRRSHHVGGYTTI